MCRKPLREEDLVENNSVIDRMLRNAVKFMNMQDELKRVVERQEAHAKWLQARRCEISFV